MGDVRTQLLAIQALVTKALSDLETESAVVPVASPEFMDTADFAARHGLCADTVRRYAKAGMPHERLGRELRIPVQDADAWLRSGGAVGAAQRDGALRARRGA